MSMIAITRENINAVPLKELTLQALSEIIGDDLTPGASTVVDPIAVTWAAASNLEIAVLDGRDFDRIEAAIEGQPFEEQSFGLINMVDAAKVKESARKSQSRAQASSNVPPTSIADFAKPSSPSAQTPETCGDQACSDKLGKQERNERMMRIMMFVFLGLFGLPLFLRLLGF